eukprot:GEMP01042306.1.p1 GENE.GEMP01042306.1~~GEMP01042306.1.p1  ORF type:complete len:266 (+),score=22.13 GEMP01042306.1:194-991(+)
MANFTDVGAPCSDPYCNQSDFLPFTCDCCNRVFCLDHFQYKDHKCPDAVAKDQRAAVCPMCKKTFALVGEGNDESISILWNRHISSGCTGRSQKPRCPVKGCKEKLTELNTFDCKKCKQKVCMKHRFEDAHLCQEAQKQSSRSRYNFWSSSSASTKPSAQASKADAPKSTGNGKWPCGRCGQCSKCEASKGGVGDQWACPACTLSNPANGMKCGACGAARPSTGATAPRESRREWKCTRCHSNNPDNIHRCASCNQKPDTNCTVQ